MSTITICCIGDIMMGRYDDSEKINLLKNKLNSIKENKFSNEAKETIYGNKLKK